MKQRFILFLLLWASTALQVSAQGMLQMLRRNDSLMTERYRRGKGFVEVPEQERIRERIDVYPYLIP